MVDKYSENVNVPKSRQTTMKTVKSTEVNTEDSKTVNDKLKLRKGMSELNLNGYCKENDEGSSTDDSDKKTDEEGETDDDETDEDDGNNDKKKRKKAGRKRHSTPAKFFARDYLRLHRLQREEFDFHLAQQIANETPESRPEHDDVFVRPQVPGISLLEGSVFPKPSTSKQEIEKSAPESSKDSRSTASADATEDAEKEEEDEAENEATNATSQERNFAEELPTHEVNRNLEIKTCVENENKNLENDPDEIEKTDDDAKKFREASNVQDQTDNMQDDTDNNINPTSSTPVSEKLIDQSFTCEINEIFPIKNQLSSNTNDKDKDSKIDDKEDEKKSDINPEEKQEENITESDSDEYVDDLIDDKEKRELLKALEIVVRSDKLRKKKK